MKGIIEALLGRTCKASFTPAIVTTDFSPRVSLGMRLGFSGTQLFPCFSRSPQGVEPVGRGLAALGARCQSDDSARLGTRIVVVDQLNYRVIKPARECPLLSNWSCFPTTRGLLVGEPVGNRTPSVSLGRRTSHPALKLKSQLSLATKWSAL